MEAFTGREKAVEVDWGSPVVEEESTETADELLG